MATATFKMRFRCLFYGIVLFIVGWTFFNNVFAKNRIEQINSITLSPVFTGLLKQAMQNLTIYLDDLDLLFPKMVYNVTGLPFKELALVSGWSANHQDEAKSV